MNPIDLSLNQHEKRAFELDALRGLALLMMILHHFAFDLRYVFALDLFAFQEAWWFNNLLRPVFLNVFIIVSGISCTFSRNNTRRGIRMLAVSLLLTVLTLIFSSTTGYQIAILFNVLHLISLGTLLYAAVTVFERRRGRRLIGTDVFLLLFAGLVIWFATILPHWADAGSYWLLPFGLVPDPVIGMADYLPIFPWLGFYAIGALIGRIAYTDKTTALPNAPLWLIKATAPLSLMGRNSLWIYALHQPVLLILLFGLSLAGIF